MGLFTKKDTYTVIKSTRRNGIIKVQTVSKQLIYYPESPLIIQQNNGSRIIDTFCQGIEVELSFQSDEDLNEFLQLCKYK